MVMLKLHRLKNRPSRKTSLKSRVKDEVASMYRTDALEAYLSKRDKQSSCG